jgi:hypothetical protein
MAKGNKNPASDASVGDQFFVGPIGIFGVLYDIVNSSY